MPSLFCWQAASAGRQRTTSIVLLAATLALMSAPHYYSIFFAIPLFLGELVRWRKSGKPDIAVLAAISTMMLVLAMHYPLIEANSRYAVSYWSPANWSQIRSFYEFAISSHAVRRSGSRVDRPLDSPRRSRAIALKHL